MPERGEWIQLIIFIVFVALAALRQVIGAFLAKKQGESPESKRPPSPGIQLLEQLRREQERPATTTRSGSSSSSAATGSSDREAAYDDGSDDEDAYSGDDEIRGKEGLRDDTVDDDSARWSATERREPRTSPVANQYALEWEDVVDDTRRTGPPAPPARSSRRRSPRRPQLPADLPAAARSDSSDSRSVLGDAPLTSPFGYVDSATSGTTPLSKVVHPRTEHVRTESVRTDRVKSTVATPRVVGEHPEMNPELNLADAAADLGMDQIPRAEGTARPAGRRVVPSPLLRHGMDLRQALIGQVILSPPRAHQGPHRPGAGLGP